MGATEPPPALANSASSALRAAWWLRVAAFLTTLSVGAVADRVLGYPALLPRVATRALAWFVEPGLTIWWCTVGGLFEGFPSSQTGYAVTVIGNLAFWLAMVVIARRLLALVSRRHWR